MLTLKDADVFEALAIIPETSPIEAVAAFAGVTMDELRASMRRLALRDVQHELVAS
jgi:hypothetical protein